VLAADAAWVIPYLSAPREAAELLMKPRLRRERGRGSGRDACAGLVAAANTRGFSQAGEENEVRSAPRRWFRRDARQPAVRPAAVAVV